MPKSVDRHEPLPVGLQKARLQFRARRNGQAWVYFGRDYPVAIAAFVAWKGGRGDVGTICGLMDEFIGTVCPDRIAAKKMAPRTLKDYAYDALDIKQHLGHIPLTKLEAKHIAKFRDLLAKTNPSHVRNVLACLSSALSWAAETGYGGLKTNVCKDVSRGRKTVRERLITDAEYLKVYEVAIPAVRLAMVLAVRTLGLPEDIIAMGPKNVVTYPDGKRTLRFRRGKTNIPVEVEIIGDLAAVLDPLLSPPTLHRTFLRKTRGDRDTRAKPYTVDGLGGMFRRYCGPEKANVADFGLRDLRAKGATDMYRAGVPIQQIQFLLGHKSVTTTEIYLKGLITEIVKPNMLPIMAAVK